MYYTLENEVRCLGPAWAVTVWTSSGTSTSSISICGEAASGKMWKRHPKTSLKVPQIQKFMTFHHIYPGALLPQLPTLGHESDVVCTSVTSTSLDCLTSQTQEIALDQHSDLPIGSCEICQISMLAFQPKLKQATSLLHSAASWLDGMEMGGRRNGEACEQDPQHACEVYMQVHIHVVYLPLSTSHTQMIH